MVLKTITLICILFSFVYSCDIDCHGGGVCSTTNSSKCDCRPLYDGDYCQDKWLDSKLFFGLFITYTVYEILLQVINTCYACYQIYTIGKITYSTPFVILVLCAIGGILRIIGFSVDSHNSRGILSPIAFNLLFDIPLILWLISAFMLYLFWIEIQHNLNPQLVFITKFRLILIAFVILSTSLIVGVEIFNSTTNSTIGSVLYLVVFAIMFIGLIAMISYSGINMVRVLKRAYTHTGSLKHYQLLRQLLFYMVFIDICLIASVACVISYAIVLEDRNRGGYLIVHTLFRTLEFGVVFGTLVFLQRKKTKTASSSEDMSRSFEQSSSGVTITAYK